MVKNAGGNKSKRVGRKHTIDPDTIALRYAIEVGEVYAVVIKIFGGTCQVICHDGTTRICVIRKKFKGRGKRGNILSAGSWLLVGIRDWEANSKTQKCDLLEVYSPADKDHLLQTCVEDLTALKSACIEFNDDKCNIEFSNQTNGALSDDSETEEVEPQKEIIDIADIIDTDDIVDIDDI